jgi:hypothetical protein
MLDQLRGVVGADLSAILLLDGTLSAAILT